MSRGKQKKQIKDDMLLGVMKAILFIFPIALFMAWRIDCAHWTEMENIEREVMIERESWGFSYDKATEILRGNIGELITIVSLILSITMSISERSEKKVYGIPRSELNIMWCPSLYKWTRRISYAAPGLMLIFINLSCTTCGYMVLVFSYVFLAIQHWLYNRSYDYGKNREAVIEKLTEYPGDHIDMESVAWMDCLGMLEMVKNALLEEANWKSAQQLYYAMVRKAVKGDGGENMDLFCLCFFYEVFWKGDIHIAIRTAQYCISKSDQGTLGRDESYENKTCLRRARHYMREKKCSGDVWNVEAERNILLGMLAVISCYSEEEELVKFLNWFFDFPRRSVCAVEKSGDVLQIERLQEQAAVVMVFLERRLEENPEFGIALEHRIWKIWEFCEGIYKDKALPCDIRLLWLEGLPEENMEKLEAAREYLWDDIHNGSAKSVLKNILALQGGTEE